jgi:hypothetical protein
MAGAFTGVYATGVYAGEQSPAADYSPAPTMAQLVMITRDAPLIQAIQSLWRSGEHACVNALLGKPVKLVIKPLETLDPSLKNYDALSWISPQGEQFIFVSERHRNAPPPALAALIGHEVLHEDEQNSVAEEISGWTMEAQLWHRMKAFYPGIETSSNATNSPLVTRLNQLDTMWQQGTLAAFVRQHPAYRKLGQTSPGFTDVTGINAHSIK